MPLPIPPLQDVVRLTGPDLATTAANFRKYLQGSGPVWGYGPSKKLAKAVFSLKMTREVAVEACAKAGHVLGRSHNAEVGGLIWDAADSRGQFLCHDLVPRYLNLRADFAIKVDPQFFFVDEGRPVIFYLQPRRGLVPADGGLRVIASAIHTLFAVDDLSAADLLLLDLSIPEDSSERALVSLSFDDIPPLPAHETEQFFQRFVNAYDLLSEEGVQGRERKPHSAKDRGDDMFSRPLTV